jgi:ribosomal protein L3
VDADENLLLVFGSVPGPVGTYILIHKAARQAKVAKAAKQGK